MKIKTSAPAKVHLIGEHAVVYGHPAIIAAVGKRIYIEAERSDKVIFKDERWTRTYEWTLDEVMKTTEHAQQLWNQCKEKGNYSELASWAKDGGKYITYHKAVFGIVLKMVGADSGINVHVTKSEIPAGSGIGSSASYVAALTKAVSEVYKKNLSIEKINDIVFECEKLAHGMPSGGDNTTCCYGGLVWFQKAQPKNIVIPLKNEIPHKLEGFVLAYTKQPEKSTAELVQMVKEIPEAVRNPKMEEIGRMCQEMKEVLKKKNYKRMKEIINKNNQILASFGLAIPETEAIADKVKALGGAAKMCGACYGGVMLCWHDKPELVVQAIKQLGFQPMLADLAVEGVRLEK